MSSTLERIVRTYSIESLNTFDLAVGRNSQISARMPILVPMLLSKESHKLRLLHLLPRTNAVETYMSLSIVHPLGVLLIIMILIPRVLDTDSCMNQFDFVVSITCFGLIISNSAR